LAEAQAAEAAAAAAAAVVAVVEAQEILASPMGLQCRPQVQEAVHHPSVTILAGAASAANAASAVNVVSVAVVATVVANAVTDAAMDVVTIVAPEDVNATAAEMEEVTIASFYRKSICQFKFVVKRPDFITDIYNTNH
jgi:hypothetical protein